MPWLAAYPQHRGSSLAPYRHLAAGAVVIPRLGFAAARNMFPKLASPPLFEAHIAERLYFPRRKASEIVEVLTPVRWRDIFAERVPKTNQRVEKVVGAIF